MSFDLLIAAPNMLAVDAIKSMVDHRTQHMTVMDESGHFFGSVGLMETVAAYVKQVS
jgi:CBS domain containing-hemolysin-like protein